MADGGPWCVSVDFDGIKNRRSGEERRMISTILEILPERCDLGVFAVLWSSVDIHLPEVLLQLVFAKVIALKSVLSKQFLRRGDLHILAILAEMILVILIDLNCEVKVSGCFGKSERKRKVILKAIFKSLWIQMFVRRSGVADGGSWSGFSASIFNLHSPMRVILNFLQIFCGKVVFLEIGHQPCVADDW
ncbi:hypothetical protein KFK09_026382 [Dendrobium nobile]|uniref:Uncharacterized protein n=1 Tax=Dendrobium nobile TaxID=94219 RepID=A0A8T3A6M6_DENNO|nr:hypothetical protein KFK09_026382 [Dendrobium nobile]